MKKGVCFFLLILVFFLSSCTNDENITTNNNNVAGKDEELDDTNLVYVPDFDNLERKSEDSIKALYEKWLSEFKNYTDTFNMVYISAKGDTFIRGDLNLKGIDYKSVYENKVTFTYNFWIDNHEVTQKEYYVFLGKKSKLPPSFSYWKDMEKPVGYLSFSQTILYCNAKSKFFNKDTVYTYDIVNGEITNIQADFSKNGYSLPTPSEWEYIAKKYIINDYNIKSNEYTYAGQSGGSPKSINDIKPTFGIYNFFGNMSEYCWGVEYPYIKDSLYVNPELEDYSINTKTKIVAKGGNLTTPYSSLNPAYREYIVVDLTGKKPYYGLRTVLRKFN